MHKLVAAIALLLSLVAASSRADARDVPVATAAELTAAIAAAAPGDVITLADGVYALSGANCNTRGTDAAPIVVRAATPLGARVDFDGLEGFHVRGAHWHFEGLDVRGVCVDDSACEHAFHVVGAAVGFVLRGSRVRDFNAQLKVNAAPIDGVWTAPHGGLVEGNEVADTRPRVTGNPVTKLNINNGDNWIVRANLLHDFHKDGGDGVSYGAFMKGGSMGGLFERNLVSCTRDVATGGTRLGLSFGGGGTGAQFCAPAYDATVPCNVEHTAGWIRNNIVVNCSDVGVYLNRSADTRVIFNTLIATTGIDFRFDTTSGEAIGNVLGGNIRDRNGAVSVRGENLTSVSDATFTSWYAAPLAGDLRVTGDVSMLLGVGSPRFDVVDDYCARERPFTPTTIGALEHSLGDCDTTRPPVVGGGGMTPDAGVPSVDAGAPVADGGLARDSGAAPDGGPMPDGGSDAGATGGEDSGCACRVGARPHGSPIALALVTLLLVAGLRGGTTMWRAGRHARARTR